jgi:ornithine carbamoyltransferase
MHISKTHKIQEKNEHQLRHCTRISDFSPSELREILLVAAQLKSELQQHGQNKPIFAGKTLAMIFEKPSLRTRISFEIGMTQLGGHAIFLGPQDIQMGTREPVSDVSIVTSSMADMIMARTFKHQTVTELAEHSSVPVINGLSDLEHPCQILADFLTIQETLGRIENLKIAFIGDGNNNVTHSLAQMAVLFGNTIAVAAPKGYEMREEIVEKVKELAAIHGGELIQTTDMVSAVKNADVVVADTWVSMGSEAEAADRIAVFKPYQVTQSVMAQAKETAIFMHCLPAYRGKEVEAAVIDGPESVVFQEAENRLHAQKGLLVWLAKTV